MELQMVMMLKMNQWKWMLNSLKMLMIRIFANSHYSTEATFLKIKLRGCDEQILQEMIYLLIVVIKFCPHVAVS